MAYHGELLATPVCHSDCTPTLFFSAFLDSNPFTLFSAMACCGSNVARTLPPGDARTPKEAGMYCERDVRFS